VKNLDIAVVFCSRVWCLVVKLVHEASLGLVVTLMKDIVKALSHGYGCQIWGVHFSDRRLYHVS